MAKRHKSKREERENVGEESRSKNSRKEMKRDASLMSERTPANQVNTDTESDRQRSDTA